MGILAKYFLPVCEIFSGSSGNATLHLPFMQTGNDMTFIIDSFEFRAN
jgi:hypothetical protein